MANEINVEKAIQKIEIEGLRSLEQKEFLYLLGVEENKTLDEKEINRGIKRLFLKNIFEDIVVEYKNQTLKVRVIEKPIIKEIEIKGNEYFSEQFYKKLLKIKKGDRLTELSLRKTKENIETELTKRGYRANNVNWQIVPTHTITNAYHDVKIVFLIKEGEPERIKNIKWEGISDEHIKNLFPLTPREPFDRVEIENFIVKTKKYLKNNGLIGSEINYTFKDGELIIRVKEGIKLTVEIEGNDYLKKGDLKDIVMAHFEDKIDEIIIKDTINSLINFYKINGFLNVRIVPLIEKTIDEWKIVYFVNEGKRKFVEKIIFEPQDLSDTELKNILANREGQPFNPDEITNDKKRIEEYLKSKGYYKSEVYNPEIKEEDDKVSIIFRIQKGKLIKITSINVLVKNDLLKQDALNSIKDYIDLPFNESVFLEIRRKIRDVYIKNGYSDVVLKGNYEIIEDKAYINIEVEPKSKKYFGKSVVLGNKKTKTKFIYQRLLPKEGMPYNPYTIDEERQALYRTGLFSKIDITPEILNDKVDLIYNFEEIPAGAFEIGFGYGEYERAKAFFELSYINLFGLNKQIFTRVELSTLESRSYITYVDPWFWKDLTFKSSLILEKMNVKNIDTKDIIYKIKRLGLSTGFEKKFTDTFKAELLYELTSSKTWDVKPEVVISDIDIGRVFISGVKASLIFDTRDNAFDPHKGWLAGVTSKLSNEFLGSEINFLKTSFYINKYTELTKWLVLANSIRAGWAWLYGKTEELPISERYFLGGRDSVRGYAQNTLGPKRNNQPTGGNAFLMGNVELRTYLGKNFYLINFLDFGNLWSRVGDASVSKLKYTTGVGLRYKTPVGPLRIDYGYKLNREEGESRGEIHFSIGHTF
ncbi:BamA/TamA family outer membrane protein [Thermodesulfovibrio hydrogeniphilus]